MDIYNISEYITIVRQGLKKYNSQGPAGILLLSQIANLMDNPIDFDDSKITRLVKHQTEVQVELVNFAATNEIEKDIIEGFKNNVEPNFNTITISNACHNLISLINKDHKMSNKNKEILNEHYNSNDYSTFLAHGLIHAVGRVNTLNKKINTSDDFPYLAETNNQCPFCNKNLIRKEKEKNIPYYKITKIFDDEFDEKTKKDLETAYAAPKSLNSFDNKIALCVDCVNNYKANPTLDTYKSLYDKKREFEKNSKIVDRLNTIDVEHELYNVIQKLAIFTKDDAIGITELDPKEIKNKIPDDFMLRDEITRYVLKYYKFIEQQFSDLDSSGINSFNVIAAQINLAFKKLDDLGTLSQREIYYNLSQWIIDKIRYRREQIGIVNIIVAFFVQNCEVFYEIT